MAERSLGVKGRSPVSLVYRPELGETIGRIEIPLPEDGIIYGSELAVQLEATDSFKRQCGNQACDAEVYVSTIGTHYGDGSRKVWSASMKCFTADCPLGQSRGGGANDREPSKPLPSLPELCAENPIAAEMGA